MGFVETDNIWMVNVLTLDGMAGGSPMDDVRSLKVTYWDGRRRMGYNLGDEPREGGI
jgi:hypothetical protein